MGAKACNTGNILFSGKIKPASMLRNPVMFVVEIGAVITTLITILHIVKGHHFGFNFKLQHGFGLL